VVARLTSGKRSSSPQREDTADQTEVVLLQTYRDRDGTISSAMRRTGVSVCFLPPVVASRGRFLPFSFLPPFPFPFFDIPWGWRGHLRCRDGRGIFVARAVGGGEGGLVPYILSLHYSNTMTTLA